MGWKVKGGDEVGEFRLLGKFCLSLFFPRLKMSKSHSVSLKVTMSLSVR